MAPLPPPKQDHEGPLHRRAAMLGSTAMARVGFGLSERAPAGDRPGAAGAPAISLANASVKIEDGLLMAFGPDGDPIPPTGFAAMAAEQPDAVVALAGGSTVPAVQVAAVLEAQAKGPLAGLLDPAGGEAWIKAMLGLGPQPVLAAEAELRGEDRVCELTIFGRELMLAVPGGRSFLITDAAPADLASASVGLVLADGEALSVRDLIERLRAKVGQRPSAEVQAGAVRPFAEVVLSGCVLERTGDALLIELPALGTVRLAAHGKDAPAGPRVSIVLRDGQAADLAQVIAALGPTETPPAGSGKNRAATPGAAKPGPAAPGAATPGPAAAGAAKPGPAAARQGRPVSFSLPRVEGVDPDRVAVVIIGGVPAGGAFSAGFADGDGRWVLSPRQLAGLTFIPPPGWSGPLDFEVTAVALRNRGGEYATASERVVVAQGAPAETLVRLAIDPSVVRRAGSTLNALMIRGVPPAARLSAGTYDPATGGWVLRPDQLEGLAVALPAGEGDFTLTVVGISLGIGGRADARVLTRLPVAAR